MAETRNQKIAEQRIEEARKTSSTGLDLRGLTLTTLPDSLENLTQLRVLALGNNSLTSLPDWLGNLTQLQGIAFDHNGLSSLPEWLGNLTQLRLLFLDHNNLSSLPDSMRNLTQLQILSLINNNLSSLPDWLGNITQLQQLDLANNNLSSLPDSMRNLTQLQKLNLKGNPLNPELAAARSQGLDRVLNFLKEDHILIQEAKLIFVGEGAVGKSSLLAALRRERWREKRITTHGIEIKKVTFPASDTSSGLMTLNGWDFGGQPVYRPTHQIFFTAPAVYLVVWNPRMGPEQCAVDYWISLIRRRAYDAERPEQRPRILVVATHRGFKERLARIDETRLREQFGEMIVDFHHVDSKSRGTKTMGEGMAELSTAIAQTAQDLPNLRRKYPKRWQKVREALVTRNEPFLRYDDFVELCRQNGLDDAEGIENFAAVSHELGQLVHYADDETLRDIVIFKADWLSKALSFVLEDAQVSKDHGLIRHERLNEIWNDPHKPVEEQYPAELHPIFLRLMERFELSYRIVYSPGETPVSSLIAQLVPGDRPDNVEAIWNAGVLPGDAEQTWVLRLVDTETNEPAPAEGLFYRIIVRFHSYSLGKNRYDLSCHWQHGLILEDGLNGRAFLEQTVGNQVRITVRAAYPGNLLHLLTREIKELVERIWKGVECQITVPCRETCGKGTPGQGLFPIEDILANRREGQPRIWCSIPKCRSWQGIDALMASPPVPVPSKDSEAILALRREMRAGFQEMQQSNQASFADLKTDVRALASLTLEEYRRLMLALTDEAMEGPRLISIAPAATGLLDNPKLIAKKYRLTLWCEHSKLPLPVLYNDKSRGAYEIEQPQEWFKKASPYFKRILPVLKALLPMAIADGKWEIGDDAFANLELDLFDKGLEAMLDDVKEIAAWEGEAGMSATGWRAPVDASLTPLDPFLEQHYGKAQEAISGGVLRSLQVLLKKQDASFGGLERVQDRTGRYIWVHPMYVSIYRPEPPVIPSPSTGA